MKKRSLARWLRGMAAIPFLFTACDSTLSDHRHASSAQVDIPSGPTTRTSAPNPPETTPETAGDGRACLSHTLVDFGVQPIGTQGVAELDVVSCGTGPLLIRDVQVSGDQFSVSTETRGLNTTHDGQRIKNPRGVLLPVGAHLPVRVVFTPTPDTTGMETPVARATLMVFNDGADVPLSVGLVGTPVAPECSIAKPRVAEGPVVSEGTTLHLIGSKSQPGSGVITNYRWQVTAPIGSKAGFAPHAEVADPTFTPDAPGVYTFALEVTDEDGIPGCEVAEVQVEVKPIHDLRVSLTWTTDGQPVARDFDLHVVHELGDDIDLSGQGTWRGWFSEPWDCWADNPNPEWVTLDPNTDDDPRMSEEGAGSETVTLTQSQAKIGYRIGVHLADDHGLGEGSVTLRIFMGDVMVFEAQDVTLAPHDLWEVAVALPSLQDVTRVSEGDGWKIHSGVFPPQ